MKQKNDVVESTVKPLNALDYYVGYQYRYWLCLRNVDTDGQKLSDSLNTNMFTASKYPLQLDANTCLLYCSTTDSHLTIDNVEYTTMFTGKTGHPMQPINFMTLGIKEPYGCFFVEKIERAMNLLSTSAWSSARLYLKIDFVGTLPGGKIEVLDGVWMHFIPSGNMGVSVNNMAGAEYSMQCVITDYCYTDDIHTVTPQGDALTVKGDKVQTILNDLQDKLNRSYEVAFNKGEFGKKIKYMFDAGEFGTYDLNVNSSEQVRNAGQGETGKDGGEHKNTGQMLVVKPGVSIAQFINDKILMNTTQYTQMLAANKEKIAKADQTGLMVAKIICSSKLDDDTLTLMYQLVKVEGRSNSTIIENAKLDERGAITKQDILASKEYSTGEFSPDRNYVFDFHYTFGTENTEVENFEMRAENIMAYISGDNIGTTDNSLNMSSKSQERFKMNVFNESANQFENAVKKSYVPKTKSKDVVVLPQGRNVATNAATNNSGDFAATKKEAQAALLRFSSTPGLALQASIRGHLALLRIDKYMQEKEKKEGENTFILAKFEVRNIEGEQFWNNGYYIVNSITNKFQGGKFKQTLTGFYISDQEKTVNSDEEIEEGSNGES
jgi:hypothetical protein